MAPPHTVVIVNRQSGTVRSLGEEAVRRLVTAALPDAKLILADGRDIEGLVTSLLDEPPQRLIVGGGDGTLASVAGLVAGGSVALGVLPLGTMNMMARTLGIDADPATALAQLAEAEARPVDAGRAGGRLFLHHVAFGLQPRMVRIRERLGYSSRLTKMIAAVRASLAVIFNPQSLRLGLRVDGKAMEVRTPALVISNNVYENAMMLRQVRLDGGVLGAYVLSPMSLTAFMGLALDVLRGRWRDNLNVSELRARRIVITHRRFLGRDRAGLKATLDGELALFELPLTIESQPAALHMLVPRAASP